MHPETLRGLSQTQQFHDFEIRQDHYGWLSNTLSLASPGTAAVPAGRCVDHAGRRYAKRLGAEVTGVAGKLGFMRSVGADHVIDYRSEDFTRSGPYDLVLDLVAHRSVFAYRRA